MRAKRSHRIFDCVVFLLVIVIGVCLLRYGYTRYTRAAYPLEYYEIVTKNAEEFGITPSLVYGVIHTESHFDVEAHSYADAKGLMQLTGNTYEWALSKLQEELGDVFDPATNIRCGVKVLEMLFARFEDVETTLAAYNAGIGNVSRWLEDAAYSSDGMTLDTIPYPETKDYIQRVLNAQKMYQTVYEIP